MQEEAAPPCEVVILTALESEYQEVHKYLQDLRERTYQGTIYDCGTFLGQHRTWHVAVAQIGMGGPTAAAETQKAISYFQPQITLFVGVGGGFKDVKLGDVVAASKIYAYESGKAGERFLPRPEVGITSFNLEQRAKAEARSGRWTERLDNSLPVPRAYVGPLAAGEKVLASTRANLILFLKENYGDTLAVEMEGHGFLAAVRANHGVHALVIRGISDLIDGKSASDATGTQTVAARHAAAFAFQMLANFTLPPIGGTLSSSTNRKVWSGELATQVDDMITKEEKNDTLLPEVLCLVAQDEKDKEMLQALEEHLYPLQYGGCLVLHHRGKILPGENYERTIQEWMTRASVILLLVSPAFLASETHYQEVHQAMQRRDARVIPVLLRYSTWNLTPFAELTHLPSNDIPVANWPDQDQAWEEVVDNIRQVLDKQQCSDLPASPGQGIERQSVLQTTGIGQQRVPTQAEAEERKYQTKNQQTALEQVVDDHATAQIKNPLEAAFVSQKLPASGPSPSKKRWIVFILFGLAVLVVVLGGVIFIPQLPSGSKAYPEQEGTLGSVTYSNPYNLSGEGSKVEAGKWVQVSCKVLAPTISSVSPDGYWYRVASSPWNNAYYAIANTFMNGDPWGGPYTHNTDFNVPNC